MSFLHLPSTVDTEAPIASARGYANTRAPHVGCPRAGTIEIIIDSRLHGATVETCTACQHRRVVGRYRPSAIVRVAEPVHGEDGRFVRIEDVPVRHCACACGAVLGRHLSKYASADCRRRASEARRATGAGSPVGGREPGRRCACGCGVELTANQGKYATRACVAVGHAAAHLARLAAMPPLRATHRAAVCVGCGTTFEQRLRVPVSCAARCEPCKEIQRRTQGREYARRKAAEKRAAAEASA